MRKINYYLLLISILLLLIVGCNKDDDIIIPPNNSELSYNALLTELNFARTNPNEYAKLIEATLPYYNGNYLQYPGEGIINTYEGKTAVEEAIQALKSQQPVNALSLNMGLNKACQYHCDKQGITGQTGHNSPNGESPGDRMKMFGTFTGSWAFGENIAYGPTTARRVIIDLIIDDGVTNRGHRINIYDTKWTDVGFGWGTHKNYKMMCVMDFARGYIVN